MEDTLQKFSELCREPVLAVTQGKLSLMNAAARQLFPNCAEHSSAREFLPPHLLEETAESFLSSAELDGQRFTVSALRSGETLLLSLAPHREERSRGYLSDSLMSGIFSTLFNISLSAQQLRACLDPRAKDGEKHLEILLHNYNMLNHKLSNLGLLQQLEENDLLIIPRHADLVPLCRNLVESVNHLVGEKMARVEFSTATESLPAILDSPKVERLVINLLSNALRHTPAEGQIRLRLSKSGDNAVISVDDTGCGIPPEILNNVFSRYEARLTDQNLSEPGSGGLGLAICRTIAEKHGGALVLESRVGEGTSVRVLLPLAPEGDCVLRSEPPVYQAAGMSLLLLELSDLLDYTAYGPNYMD